MSQVDHKLVYITNLRHYRSRARRDAITDWLCAIAAALGGATLVYLVTVLVLSLEKV